MELKNNVMPARSVQGPSPAQERSKLDRKPAAEGFDSILKGQLEGLPQKPSLPNSTASGVKFSAHAIERLQSRGIRLDAEVLKRLDDAVEKAAAKGSKESLMLTDDAALIVSVKNKTVITAMDKQAMRENVFTNIDSTVIL